MEYNDRHKQVLMRISGLPRKMISVGGMDNVSEFVMHDLCSKDCFNIEKAAYLVDNPHFDCVKGIAGYSRSEAYNKNDHWQHPRDFSDHMVKNSFNGQVRSYEKPCLGNHKISDQKIREIASSLGFSKPDYHIFDLKHENNGIFLYERPQETEIVSYLPEAVCLFSFCPVF